MTDVRELWLLHYRCARLVADKRDDYGEEIGHAYKAPAAFRAALAIAFEGADKMRVKYPGMILDQYRYIQMRKLHPNRFPPAHSNCRSIYLECR